MSFFLDILYGLPQVSFLLHVLFIIPINDAVYASDMTQFVLYANDTFILVRTKYVDDLINFVNNFFFQRLGGDSR